MGMRVPTCHRCRRRASRDAREYCTTCELRARLDADADLLGELNAYWDRRLSENRPSDWT